MTGYCFDTSAFMEAWLRNYPLHVFPGIWSGIETMIVSERVVASEMVRDELQAKSDALCSWSQTQKGLFVPVDESQHLGAKTIIRSFPRLIEERRGRNQADPFVIALAKLRGLVCVTEEHFGDDKNI